ncbi:P-loop containing nucleoside triphosphate hydrolase protein [Abortiporus biennis]|nr:P-loop containing nucleoside triphosphate hydrolase protein [Abortiporus biennis]
MSTATRYSKELEDAFIKVTFEEDAQEHSSAEGDPMYGPWLDHGSAKFVEPANHGARILRTLYPNHKISLCGNVNFLGFPGAIAQPVSPPDVLSLQYFFPGARQGGQPTGFVVDQVRFGSFKLAWDIYDYILYVAVYPAGFGERTIQYLIHESSEEANRALIHAAGIWANELHEEILVYNQGFWQKSHSLWTEVQKANWADVILKEEYKSTIQKDIYGFFDSENLYKSLGIPWKRGVIMHGPPGNGKTISMKALMKDCDAKGYKPLYVKSFQSWMGEEGAMADVFEKARQMAPCILILEDLDSLINDRNRSFFLNQLDGFEGNDGILLIGSTNHLDRLDPALSTRPSRFDRKYMFDDPDLEERTLYAQYWQNKLKQNKSVAFPDSLVTEIAASTAKFSFAYLKEAFVSTLVLLAGMEDGEQESFASVLKKQIKELRNQLDKGNPDQQQAHSRFLPYRGYSTPSSSSQHHGVGMHGRFDGSGRIYSSHPFHRHAGMHPNFASGSVDPASLMPGDYPASAAPHVQNDVGRDVKNMAFNAASLGRSFF